MSSTVVGRISMRVAHEVGRTVFLDQLRTFRTIVDGLDEGDFWAPTRCRGWSVADLLSHVHVGLQEMVLGMVSSTPNAPDTDAATYWADSPADPDDTASTDHLLFIRRLTAAHRSPEALRAHLEPTYGGLTRGADQLAAGQVLFQDRVLTTGDFYAIWAVELAIHHLDLGLELRLDPPDAAALQLARETIEALAGSFPSDWSDKRVVLLGTGRVRPDNQEHLDLGQVADRLPVLG